MICSLHFIFFSWQMKNSNGFFIQKSLDVIHINIILCFKNKAAHKIYKMRALTTKDFKSVEDVKNIGVIIITFCIT